MDSLSRGIGEEHAAKAAMIRGDRSGNGSANSTSLTEVFANGETAQKADDSETLGDDNLKRESLLFKERLLALTQQNSGQGGITASENFNKLLERQSAQSAFVLQDSLTADTNLHASKDSVNTTRLPGSPLQALSPMFQMASALHQKSWSNEVGQRVIWMVNTELQQAQLQLNPKHLGPLEVKITMTADQQLNVSFLTHSSVVKEALDQAMPRLREVFDQSGLNLSNVTVQQESHKQNRDQHHTTAQTPARDIHLAENMHEDIPIAQSIHGRAASSNLVDFYA